VFSIRYRGLMLPLSFSLLLGGCSNLAYYAQAVDGHAQLLHRTRPIAGVLERDRPDTELRERLQWTLEVRAFASRELSLPDNGSYRSYADLEGEAVAWSLVAAPEFSMEPRQWCYPLIGCTDYRAYFDREEALERGRRLAEEDGLEWTVEPVAAYSTLGWMDDPLPGTVLHWPEPALAGLIFHELAHQQLYVPDDSAFNESFATAVERAGIRRWLERRGDAAAVQAWERSLQREQALTALLLQTRERLQTLYQTPLPEEELRRKKREAFARLQTELRELAAGWGPAPGLERWLERPLNNARLALVNTYERWVGALTVLLCRQGGDLAAFYRAAAELGELPEEQRRQRLQMLSQVVSRATDGRLKPAGAAAGSGCAGPPRPDRAVPRTPPPAG